MDNYQAEVLTRTLINTLQIRIQLEGMLAENRRREQEGMAPAYDEESFYNLTNQIESMY